MRRSPRPPRPAAPLSEALALTRLRFHSLRSFIIHASLAAELEQRDIEVDETNQALASIEMISCDANVCGSHEAAQISSASFQEVSGKDGSCPLSSRHQAAVEGCLSGILAVLLLHQIILENQQFDQEKRRNQHFQATPR